jgi:hypothetical protein
MKARDSHHRIRGYLRRVILLFIIAALLARVRISLWRMPYARVRERVDRLARRGPRFSDVPPMWIAGWVERLARLVPAGTCLVKALVLQVLLVRGGLHSAEVVIAARFKPGRKFDAHAWVEHRGRILIGRVDDMESYKVLRREKVPVE